MYQPSPIDVDEIELPAEMVGLIELLARNVHEVWSRKRMSEGWQYGDERDERRKLTPDLVPYEELPEAAREYDRVLVRHTLKTIVKLGYAIDKTGA